MTARVPLSAEQVAAVRAWSSTSADMRRDWDRVCDSHELLRARVDKLEKALTGLLNCFEYSHGRWVISVGAGRTFDAATTEARAALGPAPPTQSTGGTT
jgi:hypothetical protein